MSNPRTEYLKACEKYKQKHKKTFMGCLDCYDLMLSLGYQLPIPDRPTMIQHAEPTQDPPSEKREDRSLFD